MFKTLSIKAKLAAILAIPLIGIILYGTYSNTVLQKVEVGGPFYNQIVLDKDLIADVLPPPEYILESYMTAFRLLHSPADERQALIDRLAVLKSDYDSRHKYWQENLVDPVMRKELLDSSFTPAIEFYTILSNEFIPAAQAGDQAMMTDLINGKLRLSIKFIVKPSMKWSDYRLKT